MDSLYLRYATPEDIPQILGFIRELAEYEHMENEVVATEELLHEWLFVKQKAEVLIGETEGKAHISRTCRNLSGGFVCEAGVSRKRFWESLSCTTCSNCGGARLWQAGVVVS